MRVSIETVVKALKSAPLGRRDQIDIAKSVIHEEYEQKIKKAVIKMNDQRQAAKDTIEFNF